MGVCVLRGNVCLYVAEGEIGYLNLRREREGRDHLYRRSKAAIKDLCICVWDANEYEKHYVVQLIKGPPPSPRPPRLSAELVGDGVPLDSADHHHLRQRPGSELRLLRHLRQRHALERETGFPLFTVSPFNNDVERSDFHIKI